MNDTLGPRNAAIDAAEQELAHLGGQVDAMRAVLIRLLQDVVRAEAQLGTHAVPDLVEANEQLVVAALLSQDNADTAAQALDEASRLAELDALTDLPNRTLLLDRFAQTIANAKRHGSRAALLFLDLDNFKQINDTLGHAAGDQTLKRVASRLNASVRAVDTVSRHGGDEFLILLAEVSQPLDAAVIAEKLIAAVAEEGQAGAAALRASIGISIYPDDGEDAATLIGRADAAMYRAKRAGPGGYAFHGKAPAPEPALQPPATDAASAVAPAHGLDDTDQERTHAHLREANEKLVLAVLSAQELQAAAERAQRRQADFMAEVANELRNPMAPIRIATTMLGRLRTDEPLLPRVQAAVESQLNQMATLMGDLLDSSRVDAGTLKLERRVVDMVGIINAAMAAFRPRMEARKQQLACDLPARALPVDGDPVRLAQIVGNLIDNASKHTHDGGRIALSVVVAGGDLMVMAVSDSGIGITPRTLPMVFDPFVQDTHAIGFNGVGLGIGLTVVRALVEAHGGSIAASSAGRGFGSRFVVTLPLLGHASAPGTAAGHATDPAT